MVDLAMQHKRIHFVVMSATDAERGLSLIYDFIILYGSALLCLKHVLLVGQSVYLVSVFINICSSDQSGPISHQLFQLFGVRDHSVDFMFEFFDRVKEMVIHIMDKQIQNFHLHFLPVFRSKPIVAQMDSLKVLIVSERCAYGDQGFIIETHPRQV